MPKVMNIVGMTTWNKRIPTCIPTVKDILNQTLRPDEFAINLDRQNFPNEREDVAKLCPELIELEKSDPVLKLYFQDIDMHCWQKSVPILRRETERRFNLFTIDDDTRYVSNWLEKGAKAISTSDWLCMTHNQNTQGQQMSFSPIAVEALRKEVDDEIVFEAPLDDHCILMVMYKYGLKRGLAPFPDGWDMGDRELGYSFRRCFIQNDDPSKVIHGQYPIDQFRKERQLFIKKGIIR